MINTGCQYLDLDAQVAVLVEICDQSDSEAESDKKESGASDDLYTHHSRSFHFFPGPVTPNGSITLLNYPPSHLEIVSPPPELS